MNKIKRFFNPTPQERLENLSAIKYITEELPDGCRNCIYYTPPDPKLPAYIENGGICNLFHTPALYEENCRYWVKNNSFEIWLQQEIESAKRKIEDKRS